MRYGAIWRSAFQFKKSCSSRKAELAARGGAWIGVDTDFRPAVKAHPGLLVSDPGPLIERLCSAGFNVLDDELAHYHRVYVLDPFGNRIELFEHS
jgi:hypothetical protein